MKKDWWKKYLSEDGYSLNLDNTPFTSLKDLTVPDGVRILTLRESSVQTLVGAVFPESLEELHLNGVPLQSLGGVNFPEGLQVLNLSNTALSILSGAVFPIGLKKLFLNDTELTSLDGVELPAGLHLLSLSNTRLTTLNNIVLPEGLQELYLDGTSLTDLTDVEFPETLQVLSLNHTKLTHLTGVKLPQGLKELFLGGTKIAVLDGVQFPQGLEALYLFSIELSQINGVSFPPKLKGLSLSSTKLTSLEGVAFPDGLEHLDLRYVNISCLDAIRFPSSLKQLYLGYTNLTNLDNVILPHGLQGLELRNTKLTNLDNVTFPNQLRTLHLGGTAITSLDSVILPDGLRYLWLGNSKLTHLPESIKNLKSLQNLNLSRLALRELPIWLPDLGLPFTRDPLGRGICLYNTSIKDVDMSIFDQSQEDILRWFEERKKQGETPLNEIKVVFLGDGEVGKTHTISRLQKNGEKIPESSTGGSTPGIAISEKTYPIDGQDIQVHFWDFGGQDILYSMHRMFMTERTIYVVMVDARKENCGTQATEWLDTIKSFAGDAPVLLAVNKIDQNYNATLDRRGLMDKYSNLKAVLYMSALNEEPEEFNSKFTAEMVELIRQSDVPKMKWPKKWKQVKDELQHMDEPYIRSREYGKICARCEVDSGGASLLNWCNDLGVCFCRQDDRLKDYVILRPDWITNAIYAVLFNKRDKVKNGLIDLAEMFRLLNSNETRKTFPDIPYEWGDMNYILDVVRKFSLSYQVDGNTEFFPMLCSADSSPVVKEYADAMDTLEFHMEFAPLPSNILHRLMVERYGELDTDNVWLTGARFFQNDTKLSAVARKDGNRLKLYVRSDDPLHAANTYLSVIAGTVERICKGLKLEIGKRWVIYKEGDRRVEFDYDDLLFNQKIGEDYIPCRKLGKKVLIAGILKQSGHSADKDRDDLLRDMVIFCGILQDNEKIWDGSEDERTTYIRDLLRAKKYIAMDQSRGGISAGGKQAGELDLDIRKQPDVRWTIFEALNLSGSSDSQLQYWNAHLDKLLDNYNATGCPFLFHVTYLSCAKSTFTKHCVTFEDHLRYYHPVGFSLTSERPTDPLAKRGIHHGGFLRAMETVYDCGGIPMTVYHFFVRIGE